MEIHFHRADFLRLLPADKWVLAGAILTTPRNKQIDLSAVIKASLIDTRVKGGWATRMEIFTPDGSVNINCSDQRLGGHNRQQCFLLISAVLDSLETCNPDLRIRWGYSQFHRGLMGAASLFVLGVATTTAVSAMSAGIEEGSTLKHAETAIPALLIALLCGWGIWQTTPWRASRELAPADIQGRLKSQPGMTGLNLTHLG